MKQESRARRCIPHGKEWRLGIFAGRTLVSAHPGCYLCVDVLQPVRHCTSKTSQPKTLDVNRALVTLANRPRCSRLINAQLYYGRGFLMRMSMAVARHYLCTVQGLRYSDSVYEAHLVVTAVRSDLLRLQGEKFTVTG